MRTKMGKRQRIALQQQANADAVRAERDEARAKLESVRQQLEGAVEATLREIVDEAQAQTPELSGDRLAMTVGYVVLRRLGGQ
jgi:hypothetical protein